VSNAAVRDTAVRNAAMSAVTTTATSAVTTTATKGRVRALVLALAMTASGLLAVGTTAVPAAAATVVEGRSCVKVGAKATVRSTQYICTKSGSKGVWRVSASTVRVGRGCTKSAELATVGARKVLHSCTRNKSRQLVWKVATKDCREQVAARTAFEGTYRDVLRQYNATIRAVESLAPENRGSMLIDLATIKMLVDDSREALKDFDQPVTYFCML
jgi:hypothetical protein